VDYLVTPGVDLRPLSQGLACGTLACERVAVSAHGSERYQIRQCRCGIGAALPGRTVNVHGRPLLLVMLSRMLLDFPNTISDTGTGERN